MKKLLSLIVFSAMGASLLFSVGVNKDELQKGQSEAIRFENYGGPHAVIESASSIVNIGVRLGRQVAESSEEVVFAGEDEKYSVRHLVDSSDSTGLDADVFYINSRAGVDHIDNLRRILKGYLMTAYDYSEEDADTLSVFVTIYNAVYRSQIENFSSKYKKLVLDWLDSESVGLSTNWEDWAGKTQIVIPLGILTGGEAVVETSEISDDKVVEALRKEEDKAVQLRENLAQIKEREASTAGEKAKVAQKGAAQEKKEGNKAGAEKRSKVSSEQQLIADKKGDEARNEREVISKDKIEAKKSESEKAQAEKIKCLTSLFVVNEKERLYSLMSVNPKTGEIVKKSALKQIREKNIYPVNNVTIASEEGNVLSYAELFLVLCGVNDNHSAVKLCLVDPDSLEIKKQSSETLSDYSSLVQYGDSFYAIIEEKDGCYLASFDKNLSLKKKSSVLVSPSSPINIFEQGVVVTGGKGRPILLSHSDFSSAW